MNYKRKCLKFRKISNKIKVKKIIIIKFLNYNKKIKSILTNSKNLKIKFNKNNLKMDLLKN